MAWTAEESLHKIVEIAKSLHETDKVNVLGVVAGQLNKTPREQVVYGLYSRVHANMRAMLKLIETSDVQALAMVARNILELSLDLKLIDKISDSLPKLMAIVRVQRLRSARQMVEFVKANPKSEIDLTEKEKYINSNGALIDAEHLRLWPDPKKAGKGLRIDHWSALNGRERAKLAGITEEDQYVEFYGLFSWHVHGGLSATWNFSDAAVRAVIFMSWKTAIDCYRDVLSIISKEFKLHAVEGLSEKIDRATYAPFLRA